MRGRPDLLSEIKKSNQIEPAEKQEVDALKNEVKDLKLQLATMSKNMEQLASLVGGMMKNQEEQQKRANRFVQNAPSKKRRISVSIPNQMTISKPVPPSPVKSMQPLAVTSLPDASTANDSDFYAVPDMPLPPASPFQSKDFAKDSSMTSIVGSLSDYDEDLLATLLTLDDDSEPLVDKSKTETEVPDTTVSLAPAKRMQEGQQVDPKLVEQLRHSLNNLPKKTQELFVERLVNAIASPESFQKQVEAVTALAQAAAQEANSRTNNSNMGNNNQQSVELATAALGSFLAQYGANHNMSKD